MVLVVVAGAGVLVIRGVLAGDMPRRLIVDQLSRVTGLRVEIAEARVSWGGRTVLKDVVIRLPLDSEPLFAAPVVRVSHAPLYRLVITGKPAITDITIPNASVAVREDSLGRWTVLRAVSTVQASMRSTPGKGGGGVPEIPSLTISAGTVTLSRPTRSSVVLPLTLDGKPVNPVSYTMDATLGSSRVTADIAIPSLEHTVNVDMSGLGPVLEFCGVDWTSPVELSATWHGGVDGSTGAGVLSIARGRVGDETLSGVLRLAASAEKLIAKPEVLTLRSPRLPRSPITLTGGSMTLASSSAVVESSRVDVAGLGALVSGGWDLARRGGEATLTWVGAEMNGGMSHEGSATVRASIPVLGASVIAATIHSSGQAPGASWNIEAEVDANARAWNLASVGVTFPMLRINDAQGPLDFSGASARIDSKWPEFTLAALSVPGVSQRVATARYDAASSDWSLEFEASVLDIPRVSVRPALTIKASGGSHGADFFDVHASLDGRTLAATGSFLPARPVPLMACVQLESPIPVPESHAVVPSPVLNATLDVLGSVLPLSLHAWGRVSSSEIALPGGALPRFDASVSIDAYKDAVAFEILRTPLLGGAVSASGAFDLATRNSTVRIDVDSVDLGAVAALRDASTTIEGIGSASLDVRVPALDFANVRAEADWCVSDVSAGGQHIQKGRGGATLNATTLEVHDIHLAQGAATITGAVRTDLTTPSQVFVDVAMSRWPLQLADPAVEAEITMSTRAIVDLDRRFAHGELELQSGLVRMGEHSATLALHAALEGRTVSATSLRAEMLGSAVTGSANFSIDDWTGVVSNLAVSDIDLSKLGSFIPGETNLRGTVSGTIATRPASGPEPLAPLQIDVELAMSDATYGPMPLGDTRARLFVGRDRAVLERATMSIASGTVNAWSRLSFHDGEPFVHLSLAVDALDIDLLAHAAKADAPHVPGRLTGSIVAGGYIREPHRAFGEAELLLSESDLGRMPVVSNLYGLLNLDANVADARGTGQFRLRLEGDALTLSRAQYFNRGTDVLGSVRIENIWKGAESPIGGVFAAALRPLKDSSVPLGKGLDRLLSALFSSAVSVRVSGTLEGPVTEVVPFADVSTGLKRIFGGVEAENSP